MLEYTTIVNTALSFSKILKILYVHVNISTHISESFEKYQFRNESTRILPGRGFETVFNPQPMIRDVSLMVINKIDVHTHPVRFTYIINHLPHNPGIYYDVDVADCREDGSLNKCAGGDGPGGLTLTPSEPWCAERHDGFARYSPEAPSGGACSSRLPIDDGDMERRDAAIDPALGVPAYLGRSEQIPAGGGSPL